MKKLTDKQFWSILREGAGIYGRTVRLIKKEYDIDITRQSVRERAMKRPDEIKDIKGQNIDIAEEGLHSLMRSKNETIRFKAVQFYLKTIGRDNGYVERQEQDLMSSDGSMKQPTQIQLVGVRADAKDKD